MKIICQTTDPIHAHLSKVASYFPEAMKQAGEASLDDDYYANLPQDSFAMPESRQFPVNSREQTLISLGYAKLAEFPLPKHAVDALDKAASIYDIDVETLYPKVNAVPEDTATYLLPDIKRFKIACADDVPVMEQAYIEKYAQMSIEQRTEAGIKLIEVAKDHGVSLCPSTHKLAGFTITSTRALKDWTDARASAAEKLGSSVAMAYTKVAQDMKKLPAYIYNRSDQLALVGMFAEMDKTAGIDKIHGKLIPDPFRTVFNTDMIPENFVKVGSALANKQLLAQLPLTFWQDVLGESGANEIAPGGVIDPEALAQVVETLPADLKPAVEAQLAAYNK